MKPLILAFAFLAFNSYAQETIIAKAGSAIRSFDVACTFKHYDGSNEVQTLKFAIDMKTRLISSNEVLRDTTFAIVGISDVYGTMVVPTLETTLIKNTRFNMLQEDHTAPTMIFHATGAEEDVNKHTLILDIQNFSTFKKPADGSLPTRKDFTPVLDAQITLIDYADDDTLVDTEMTDKCEVTNIK